MRNHNTSPRPNHFKTSFLAALTVLITACAATLTKPQDVMWTGDGGNVALSALCAPERTAGTPRVSAHRMNDIAVCYLNLLAGRADTPAKEEKALLQIARSWIGRARAQDPNSPFSDTTEAFAYLLESQSQSSDARKGNLSKAIAALRSALRTQPHAASAHRLLGRALALSGQYQAAEREFRLLIESRLGDAGTYAWLGYVFEKQQKNSEAVSLWKKASEIGAPAPEAAWAVKMIKCIQSSDFSC
ncbi:MAG: hypothetical protein O2807_00570 [bacterium]|nr:hypothetical protein [bacterium]